jgi:hypothetical protein
VGGEKFTLLFVFHAVERGRVAPGDCSPGAPTDPGVPNSGTRLLEVRIRYVWPPATARIGHKGSCASKAWTIRGRGSGKRFSRFIIHGQVHRRRAAKERRASHFLHALVTSQ